MSKKSGHTDKAMKAREKKAAYAQAYGAGEVAVAKVTGQYPPQDHLAERASAFLAKEAPSA